MRAMIKLMFAMALAVTSAAGYAQTRDVDLRASVDSGTFAAEGDAAAGPKSPHVSLTFDVGRPLGGSRDLGTRDVLFGIDGNFSRFSEKTPPAQGSPERVPPAYLPPAPVPPAPVPPTGAPHAGVPTTAAPEIDSRFATEGMLLLAGGLVVLRARRSAKAQAVG
jgi:hypothetical protein